MTTPKVAVQTHDRHIRLPVVGDIWVLNGQTNGDQCKVTGVFNVRQADNNYQKVVRYRVYGEPYKAGVFFVTHDVFLRDFTLKGN